MKYRKRPVVIDAFKLGADDMPDWFMDAAADGIVKLNNATKGFYKTANINADIKTLEGTMHADRGDYIIRGVKGEIYPCKHDIFHQTYESVKEART